MKNYLAFAWLLCSFASCIPVLGQEQPQPEAIDSQATVQMAGENDPAAGQQTASANQPPRFTGRLPRFFSRLVDATQRAKIYQIQQGFFAQKQELEQRLLALRQAENEAMQAVLTDEQRRSSSNCRWLRRRKPRGLVRPQRLPGRHRLERRAPSQPSHARVFEQVLQQRAPRTLESLTCRPGSSPRQQGSPGST